MLGEFGTYLLRAMPGSLIVPWIYDALKRWATSKSVGYAKECWEMAKLLEDDCGDYRMLLSRHMLIQRAVRAVESECGYAFEPITGQYRVQPPRSFWLLLVISGMAYGLFMYCVQILTVGNAKGFLEEFTLASLAVVLIALVRRNKSNSTFYMKADRDYVEAALNEAKRRIDSQL